MEVKNLDSSYYKAYEAFLLKFNHTLFYYSIKYKLFLEELLNVQSNYLLVLDTNDEIQAILPLMKKEGKFGTIINSLPFYGSNGGIVSSNNKAYDLLLDYYLKLINSVASATYITNPLDFKSGEIEHDCVDIRIGHWSPLVKTKNIEESVMQSYHSKTRNLVRKAMKLDVQVSIDNNAKEFLYNMHVENMESIGGKSKEKLFFDLLDKYFEAGKDYNIYIATVEEKKIGAVLLFYYNETVEYFTPSLLQEYKSYQSTSLIIYRAMIAAIEKDYTWWNWGGTWLSQEGVYHFKTRFGALDKEYKYYTKINNPKIYNATKEELLKVYRDFYVIPFYLL